MRGLRVGLVALSVVALCAWGCAAADEGGGFSGTGAVGGGGAGGAAGGGTGGTAGGGAGGIGGMGGAAGMVVSGMGGVGGGGAGGVGGGGAGGVGGGGAGGVGGGGTGGTGGSDPTMCGAGYKCQAIGAQMICVEEASSMPTVCTAGGTECTALAGSLCGTTPAGMSCIKACGTPMMAGCPDGLMCIMSPLGTPPVCSADTVLGIPPACTVGGTECAQYGTTCTNLGGIMGCFIQCTP